MEEETDLRLVYAVTAARERFESWAGMDAPHLPEDPVDAMQVRLARWQIAKFGLCDLREQALGVIEELGETFDAEEREEAVDGLGDVLVYAGQLCITARLAIGPIMDLAKEWRADPGASPQDLQPVGAAGKLAHVILKRQQRIRGYADDGFYRSQLVKVLAMVIVRALDNVVINHATDGWVDVDPAEVYQKVGSFVILRSQVDPTVTTLGVTPDSLTLVEVGHGIVSFGPIETPVAEVIEERFLDGTEQEVSDAEIVTGQVGDTTPTVELTEADLEVLRAKLDEPAL